MLPARIAKAMEYTTLWTSSTGNNAKCRFCGWPMGELTSTLQTESKSLNSDLSVPYPLLHCTATSNTPNTFNELSVLSPRSLMGKLTWIQPHLLPFRHCCPVQKLFQHYWIFLFLKGLSLTYQMLQTLSTSSHQTCNVWNSILPQEEERPCIISYKLYQL